MSALEGATWGKCRERTTKQLGNLCCTGSDTWGWSQVLPTKRQTSCRLRCIRHWSGMNYIQSPRLVVCCTSWIMQTSPSKENDDGKGPIVWGGGPWFPDPVQHTNSLRVQQLYNPFTTTQSSHHNGKMMKKLRRISSTFHFPPSTRTGRRLRRQGTDKIRDGKNFCVWGVPLIIFFCSFFGLFLLYPIVNTPATDILLSYAIRNNNQCSYDYVHPHHVQVLWSRLLFFVETQKEIEWVNEDAIKATKEQQR